MDSPTITAAGTAATDGIPQAGPARLHGPWRRVSRFIGTYVWLARDGLLSRKRSVAMIVLAGCVGALAQFGAVGLLVMFVQLIEDKESMGIAWIDRMLGPNLRSLVAVAVALVLLHALSASARYYGSILSRRLASDYHNLAAVRGLTLYGRAPLINAQSEGLSPRRVQGLLTRTPRIMGKALESMLRSVNPLFSLLGQMALLVTLNLFATVIIVPVFLLLVPVLYRVSRRIQHNVKHYFSESVQGMSKGVRDCFEIAEGSNLHGELAAASIEERWRADDRIRAYMRGYDEMLLGPHRSTFATSLVRPLVVVLVLLVLGWQAIERDLLWAILLGYIAAVSQAVGCMETLSGNLAQLNKFYRRVSDHRLLHQSLTSDLDADEAREPDSIHELTLRSNESFQGGERRIALQRGTPALLLHGRPLSRIHFQEIIDPLRRRGSADKSFWRAARFISNDHRFIEVPLITNVLGEASPSVEMTDGIMRRLDELGLRDEVDHLAEGLRTIVTDDVERSMSRELLAALRVLALRSSRAPAVFFDAAMVRRLRDAYIAQLLSLFHDQFVFICSTDPWLEIEGCRFVIAAEAREITGLGDPAWWRARADQWRAEPPDADDEPDEEDEEGF